MSIKRDNSKPREGREIVVKIFLILFVFIMGYGMGYSYEVQKTSENLNEYFDILYENEILPVGEMEIQDFILGLNQSLNETEKFEEIAGWVTENFTEYYWETGPLKNSEYNYNRCLPFVSGYYYDTYGLLRTSSPSPYVNDPAWIAYYRTGACGELAALFANVTNRTGTPVRQVYTDFKNQGNHAWVEVMLENGEWRYFDPTIYGEHFRFGGWPDGYWFGNFSNYHVNRPENIIGVYDLKTKKEITYRYPLMQYKPEVKRIDEIFSEIWDNLDDICSMI